MIVKQTGNRTAGLALIVRIYSPTTVVTIEGLSPVPHRIGTRRRHKDGLMPRSNLIRVKALSCMCGRVVTSQANQNHLPQCLTGTHFYTRANSSVMLQDLLQTHIKHYPVNSER